MAKELDKSIGELQIIDIMSFDDWKRETITNPSDIVVVDGVVKKYPTIKIGNKQYYNNRETNRQKNIENKLIRRFGSVSNAYSAYVDNIQKGNITAQTSNANNWIDFNKGISDVNYRPLYLIGAGILIFIIAIVKATK